MFLVLYIGNFEVFKSMCMLLLAQGETFEYPEVVPFRLTHNMIDAMGPMALCIS